MNPKNCLNVLKIVNAKAVCCYLMPVFFLMTFRHCLYVRESSNMISRGCLVGTRKNMCNTFPM